MQYPQLLFISDCYKYTHAAMYPKDVDEVYSLLYCRKPRLSLESLNGHIVAFGMRQAINKLITLYDEFIRCDRKKLEEGLKILYVDFMKLNPSDDSYKFLIDKWLTLPKVMPITFRAIPEGTFVANNTPIISIHCDESNHCWFVNFIETYLNSMLWKTCFVATQAAIFKRIEYDCLGYYLDDSFNFHDFSARGMNGIADCYNSSVGHILFFSGTDSIMALQNIYENYGADVNMLGSIPASEHSVMCLGGQSNELDTFKYIMTQFPNDMVSIVSDTWNLWDIIERLRTDKVAYNLIISRPKPIVLRPDSGDPFLILTGDEKSNDTRVQKGVIRLIDEYFGFNKVRIIYGDAISTERAKKIYEWCRQNNYNPTEFLCLGVGSYAYNSGIRDDVGLVTKMTWASIGGKPTHLIKNPITGNEKMSLSGKVSVDKNTRKVTQFLDNTPKDDLLNTDLTLPSIKNVRVYVKQEFLRAINMKQQ